MTILHNHVNIAKKEDRIRGYSLLLSNDLKCSLLYTVGYHIQNRTLQAFKQFGALYMHNRVQERGRNI